MFSNWLIYLGLTFIDLQAYFPDYEWRRKKVLITRGPDPQPRPRQEPRGRHGPGDEESFHRSYPGIKFY
jgi:hypothetical protein